MPSINSTGADEGARFAERSPTGVRLRIRQAPRILRRGLRHPSWLLETVRGNIRRRRDARREFSLLPHSALFAQEHDAVARVTGRPAADYAAAVSGLADPSDAGSPGNRPLFGGRPELVRIAHGIVRLCAPSTMVETGVAQGVTSAAILAAMEANGEGHLYSVDLPVLYADPEEFVGRLIPERLRHRWTLEAGPSRQVLPALARRVAPLDVFLHDADHSYDAQLEEYRAVWPHLRAGGILLSDDVQNPAFIEFAAEAGAEPVLVGDPAAASAIGLLRKPGQASG